MIIYLCSKDDVTLSETSEKFKNGSIKCIFGHAESWVTDKATQILDSLQEKGLIVLSFLDEAHIPLYEHWNNFRPHLRRVPGQLRGRAVRGAPCLAMTATLTSAEIKELKNIMGFRDNNTVILQSNPIQEHHKYIR